MKNRFILNDISYIKRVLSIILILVFLCNIISYAEQDQNSFGSAEIETATPSDSSGNSNKLATMSNALLADPNSIGSYEALVALLTIPGNGSSVVINITGSFALKAPVIINNWQVTLQSSSARTITLADGVAIGARHFILENKGTLTLGSNVTLKGIDTTPSARSLVASLNSATASDATASNADEDDDWEYDEWETDDEIEIFNDLITVSDDYEEAAPETAFESDPVPEFDFSTYDFASPFFVTTTNTGGVEVKAGTKFELDGGTITDCTAVYGGAVYVEAGGQFDFISGTIINCNASSELINQGAEGGHGGGVFSHGTVNMSGGIIKNCKSDKIGGGMYITSELNMTGGTIEECSSEYAGGVFVIENAVFTMSGQNTLINACTSTGNGGGVGAKGTFKLLSGTISACASGINGGGVYLSDGGKMQMYGGAIKNSTSNAGGGVFMTNRNTTFELYDGIIEKCSAVDNGGGVAVAGEWAYPVFLMAGGTINECTAGSQGGGVSLRTWGKMIMRKDGSTAPVISNCSAGTTAGWSGWGGGIYLYDTSILEIDGGEIKNCKAISPVADHTCIGSGGGIYLDASSSGNIKKANITNCWAVQHGGGIFTNDHSNLTIDSTVNFSGNKAMASSVSSEGNWSFTNRYFWPSSDIIDALTKGVVNSYYPCELAGSVSVDYNGELSGNAAKSPLNNYDINYLNVLVNYHGNGGTTVNGGNSLYKIIYEFLPFENGNQHSEMNGSSFKVLNNGDPNDKFEFEKEGAEFSTWANQPTYNAIPGQWDPPYAEYIGGETLSVSNYMILYKVEQNFYALWKRPVQIQKQVSGKYADLSKKFKIQYNVYDPDPNQAGAYILNQTLSETFYLKSGEKAFNVPQMIYEDCVIEIVEDLEGAGNYTVLYNDGDGGNANYKKKLSESNVSADHVILVTVENTSIDVVPTGVGLNDELKWLIPIIGGVSSLYLVYLYLSLQRKRRR